jgi:hypothetical protein
MFERQRFKQSASLKDRLAAFAQEAEQCAEALPAGPERDEMLKKAKRAQAATEIDAWANLPELQPPK